MNQDAPVPALEALTILDLSEGPAGSYAAKLFAGYGAKVIKVERPGIGDPARRDGPFAGGEPDLEKSAPFLYLNTSKLSLSLDYESPDGAAVLARLAEDADGLIDDAPTRRRAGLGLDAVTLIGRVPRLVICGVSAFSPDGPHAGSFSDLGGATAACRTGLHAYVATLLALWSAAQSEHGQVVEVNGLAALASSLGPTLARALRGGRPAAVPALHARPPMQQESLRLRDVEHPRAGAGSLPGGPFAMEETPWRAGRAPLLGEHTGQLLGEIGLETSAIEALRRAGVV